MTNIEINFTCPIKSSGVEIAEFDAAVEVTVTEPAHAATFNHITGAGDPGSGPEWDVKAYYVDIGRWDSKAHKKRVQLVPADPLVTALIKIYLDTPLGRLVVEEGIEENA